MGPEHSWLKDTGRAEYVAATDEQALEALQLLARTEGLISALEPSHAIYGGIQVCAPLVVGAEMATTVDRWSEIEWVSWAILSDLRR